MELLPLGHSHGQADPRLAVAIKAAGEAGRLLMDSLGKVAIREKNPRDLVTDADLGSQRLIRSILLGEFPDHGFLGEEDSAAVDWGTGLCWIVDPLDGTMNFAHRLPSFSVSIALFEDGQPVVGVVHDPWLGETWTAVREAGAFLNGDRIFPGSCRSLGRALLVSSFPSTVRSDSPELIRFTRIVQRASMRRLGSAALNLCYVACGRLDGYWASTLGLWDVAAGILIAREAGASVSHLSGGPMDFRDPQILVTGTESLHQELLPLLQIDRN